MPNSLTPEHLVKEDLIFEVICRGESPSGDARGLRSQLRNLLKSNVTPVWNEELLKVEEELPVCYRKIEEWEGVLEEVTACPPTGGDRARKISRLLHLQNRLKLIGAVEGVSVEGKVAIQDGLVSVQEILAVLQSANKATTQQTESADAGGVPLNKSNSLETNADNANTVATIPTVTSEELTTPVGFGSIATTASTPVQNAAQPPVTVTSSCGAAPMSPYHKLPNPLTGLFQGLSTVDGLDVDGLLKFLGTILRIREFPGLTDSLLLRLIAPYCRGLLLEILNSVLSRQGNLKLFHKEVLEAFLPGGLHDRLRCERFYRPQQTHESFGAYVTSIKEAAQVLMVTLTEREIVKVIMEGLNREERNRLATSDKPNSFAELSKLIIVSRGIQMADLQNAEKDRLQLGRESRSVMSVQPPHYLTPMAGPRRPFPPRRPLNCYSCGQVGHIRRNCTRAPAPSPDQSPVTSSENSTQPKNPTTPGGS